MSEAHGKVSYRDELYKNRSSRKIDSQRLFLREYDFLKTFSLTENQFSGKTYLYTIASRSFGMEGDVTIGARRSTDDINGEEMMEQFRRGIFTIKGMDYYYTK